MNVVNSDTKTTLLLNNAWMPITTVTARAAFTHLLKGHVTALDKHNNIFHSLNQWNTYGEFYDDQPALRSAKTSWPIPTIVVVTSKFFSRPKKKRLSLFDLAKIHGYVCQYCLKKHPLTDLTIDHVNPRSKGGKDTHDNRVLACRSCNTKKSAHSPWFDVNGQIPKPPAIPALLLHTTNIRKEWEDFLQ
jgi:5-methylcytosine-specific restriction endonuclease McrA